MNFQDQSRGPRGILCHPRCMQSDSVYTRSYVFYVYTWYLLYIGICPRRDTRIIKKNNKKKSLSANPLASHVCGYTISNLGRVSSKRRVCVCVRTRILNGFFSWFCVMAMAMAIAMAMAMVMMMRSETSPPARFHSSSLFGSPSRPANGLFGPFCCCTPDRSQVQFHHRERRAWGGFNFFCRWDGARG